MEEQAKELMKKNSKGGAAFFWKFLERFGVYFVQFAVSIILARILGPEKYGFVAIVNVFIAFATVFVQNGMNSAIIQKKNLTNEEVSSVFYINIILAIFLYLCLFFLAAPIASFYGNPQLRIVLRVLGLILLPCSITTIQTALIEKNFRFKKLFFCSFSAVILSGTAGIISAYMGLGVWALVIQQMVYRVSVMLALIIVQRWIPKPYISWTKAKPLMQFGWKILLAALIDVGYKNLRELIIGKKYGQEDLALYDKGKRFPEMIVSNVNGSIQSVLLPKLSVHKDDRKEVKKIVKSVIKISSFFIIPMMVGFALVAQPMIDVLLGEEWKFCVPYLRWFCFAFAFWPLHTANIQTMTALGYSSKVLILEIIKKAMGIIIILVTVWFSPLVMAAGYAASSVVSAFINAFPNKKLIHYSIFEQVKDILPCLLCAMVMGCGVYALGLLSIPSIWLLLIQIFAGVIIYFGMALLLKLEAAKLGLNLIKSKLRKHKEIKSEE